MAYRSRSDSFKTIIIIVLGVVFGISLLAISYKATLTSSEKRSKAAEEETIVKQWEFSGNTTEGWQKLKNIENVYAASDGLLHILTKSSLPKTIYAANTNFALTGIKKVKVGLRVNPTTGSCPSSVSGAANNAGTCLTPTPYQFPITVEIHYFKKVTNNGDTSYEEFADSIKTPLKIERTGDGQLQEYALTLPDTLHTMRIGKVEIRFNQVLPFIAEIDYIRFVNTTIPATPTPPTSPTPTKTPTATLAPTSTPTPTPPDGCYYGPQCAGTSRGTACPVVLICPTTTTPVQQETVTRTGTVSQDNLEGTSKYLLTVSSSEKYRLVSQPDRTNDGRGSHGVTTDTGDIFKQYVGKTVIVTGTIAQTSGKTGFGGIGVPTPSQPTFYVQTIRQVTP
jgi:hypothetical protein